MRSSSSLLLALLLLPGCVVSNTELATLRQEVDQLKEENAAIRNSLAHETDPDRGRLTRVEKKVDQLGIDIKQTRADARADHDSQRAELNVFSGRIDETNHAVRKVSSESAALMENADTRMTGMENRLAKAELQIAALERERSERKSSGEKSETSPADTPKKSSKALYQEGLEAYKAKKYKETRAVFGEYLRYYADTPLANNAQFWIGESYYGEKNYERAIVEYNEVIQRYPKGSKVPAAMLKQGMAFVKMGDVKTGDALYEKLVDAYPKTEEAAAARKILSGRKKKK